MNNFSIEALAAFFNQHHDKFVCTANNQGEPNASLMGTPRITQSGSLDFWISDPASVTLQNIRENRQVQFVAYNSGPRARDYEGARIQAEVIEIYTSGEHFEHVKELIRGIRGEEKASELVAVASCKIKKVRPIVDRGQSWNEPPLIS